MKIWKLIFDADNYEWFIPSPPWLSDMIQSFCGNSLQNEWVPIEVECGEPEKALPISDFPLLYSHIPVLSSKAFTILSPTIKDDVEFLQIAHKGEDYYALNVVSILNCVDYQKSVFRRFPSTGRIMAFQQYAFNVSEVKNHHIFKIPDEPLRYPFVSDQFRSLCIENKLTGCKFEQVWSSERNE